MAVMFGDRKVDDIMLYNEILENVCKYSYLGAIVDNQ